MKQGAGKKRLKPFIGLLVSWAVIFSAFPGAAASTTAVETSSVPANWAAFDLSSEIYTVERLPVESSVMTSDRFSVQTFAEQMEEDRTYEENCILVTIAHEYSVPNQLFGPHFLFIVYN